MVCCMKKKSLFLRTVKTMDEEVRVIGICTECNSTIIDDIEEYYCDEEGNLLCSHECLLEHFNVNVMEV